MDEIKKIITVDTSQALQSLEDYKRKLDDVSNAMMNYEFKSREWNEAAEEYDRLQKQIKESTGLLEDAVRSNSTAIGEATTKMNGLSEAVDKAGNSLQAADIGGQLREATAEVGNLDGSLNQSEGIVGNYTKVFKNGTNYIVKSLKSVNGGVGDIAGALKGMLPLIRSINSTAVGGLNSIKAAIASTGIGLLVLGIGQLINWIIKLKNKADEEAERAKERIREVYDTYKEYHDKILQLEGRFFSEQERLYSDYQRDRLQAEHDTQQEEQSIRNVHNQKLAELHNNYEDGRYQTTKQYIEAIEAENARYEKERVEAKERSEKLLANIDIKYKNDEITRQARNIKESLDEKKKQLKLQLDLEKAQANAQIKNKIALNDKLIELERQYWAEVRKEQNKALVHIDMLAKKGSTGAAQILQTTKDEMTQIQTNTINFETNAEETSRTIRNSIRSTKKEVDQYQKDYERKLKELTKFEKEQILEVESDITQVEEEKQKKRLNIEKSITDTKIKYLEDYAKHYEKDADKRIQAETEILNLKIQMLSIDTQLSDIEKSQAEEATARYRSMIEYEKQRAELQAQRLENEVEKPETGDPIQDEIIKNNQLFEIDKQLIEQKIELERQYLETTVGNDEERMNSLLRINQLQLQLSQADKKRQEDDVKFSERIQKRKTQAQKAAVGAAGQLFGAMSELAEENSDAQKIFAIMETSINTAKAAQAAYAGGVQTIPGPAGNALGIALATAATLQGIAQIKKMKATNKNNPDTTSGDVGGGLSAVGVNPLLDVNTDLQRMQNIVITQDNQDEQQQNIRVIVVESDITDAQHKAEVRESDATF